MITAEDFSREFTIAIRKLNEAILLLNKLSGFTDWKEVKAMIDKAREEVDFILPEETQTNEEYISVHRFCNDLGYMFTEKSIIERLKNDENFFKKCARLTEHNIYEIKKETAINYLSKKSGKIATRIRHFVSLRKDKPLPSTPIC